MLFHSGNGQKSVGMPRELRDKWELVGRHDALNRLRDLYADCEQGQGRVVLVSGGPGMGKTELLDHFADQVWAAGGLVLTATGSRAEGSLRMGVMGQLFHSAALPPETSKLVTALVTHEPVMQRDAESDPLEIRESDAGAVPALAASCSTSRSDGRSCWRSTTSSSATPSRSRSSCTCSGGCAPGASCWRSASGRSPDP